MKNIILDGFLYKVHDKIFTELKDCRKSHFDCVDSDYLESQQPVEQVKKYKRYLELWEYIESNYKGIFVEDIFYIS